MGAAEFAEDYRREEVDMARAAGEGGYFSDAEVVTHVREALKAVALGDREQYDWLLYEVLEPTEKMGPDHEALLVTTLRALSGVVSYIDVDYHRSLYSSIFKMSLWRYGTDVRAALMDLIISLAASGGVYLDGCLDMLVRNFLPPRKLKEHLSELEWRARKKDVIDRVLSALQEITQLVPLTPMRLWPIIIREMPKSAANKAIVLYAECMLQLESSMIGEFIGSSLLKALVDRLMDLDADISWEEILQEDYSKGVFDMELEDVRENAGDDDRHGKIREETQDCSQDNKISEKLDSLDCLMALTCSHLKSCADDGRLMQVFKTLVESFEKTVLNAHKSKFAQFVVFYACSLDPENCGTQFAFLLRDTFLSRTNPPLFRMSGVSYLASYLSRAKFLGSSLVVDVVESLIDWCFEYCQFVDSKKTINPTVHRVFYSAFQAIMYIFCFRMKTLMNDPYLKSRLFHMPLESVLCHPLDPLKVCLPSIVEEFLHQAKAAHLFSTSRTFLFDNLLESELSKTFGGLERLDMFFPFDPYLLTESDRFIRPNFVFWSTVKKAYDDYDTEEEDADEIFEDGHGANLEKTCLAESIGSFGGDQYLDIDSDDDLGRSMNKMSITPKDTLKHHFASNVMAPPRMPARIRPSTSPPC